MISEQRYIFKKLLFSILKNIFRIIQNIYYFVIHSTNTILYLCIEIIMLIQGNVNIYEPECVLYPITDYSDTAGGCFTA